VAYVKHDVAQKIDQFQDHVMTITSTLTDCNVKDTGMSSLS